MRHVASLPAAYFDALYARDSDPWRFASSGYERSKYDATLAALSRPRYAQALEVGCSIGVLTQDLAARCDHLLALDAAAQAAAEAARRCAGLAGVTVRQATVPADWPQDAAPFDLILLSEILYYLDPADLARLAAQVAGTLAPGGEVLLVHWTGETDYPLSGDDAAERFIRHLAPAARLVRQSVTPHYRLDALCRAEDAAAPR